MTALLTDSKTGQETRHVKWVKPAEKYLENGELIRQNFETILLKSKSIFQENNC